jgi:SAM-dependent methyltransferase
VSVQAVNFWNERILLWEKTRYGEDAASFSWLERFSGGASRSVRYRMELAEKLLLPVVKGKTVLELGCGTARLAEPLLAAGARHYTGLDIAGCAIQEAIRRVGERRDLHLRICDVTQMTRLDADIVFSLGLLDWLPLTKVEHLLQLSASTRFLHSFSEQRPSPAQWVHRAYVHLAYGHRSGKYVPQYYPAKRLQHFAGGEILRDRRLSFGAMLTNLPCVG